MRIFFLLLIASCGIIKSQKEIISITSVPSGIEVIQNGKDPIGKTPLFLEVEEGSQDTYGFKPLKKLITPQKRCDYNQTSTLKEGNDRTVDDVIKGVNPVGLINGSKYDCVRIVRAKIGLPSETCKKIVAVPPKSNYIKTSLEIFNKYKKEVFDKNKKACDEIISPYDSEDYFSFLGIDHISPPTDLSDLDTREIFKIGLEFKATHILFLTYERENSKINVSPKIYDIHEGILESGPLTKAFSIHQKDEDSFSNFLLSTFRLFPNGFGFQGTVANELKTSIDGENGPSYIDKDFKMGITLDNILYPVEKWAVNLLAVPSFIFSYQKQISITGVTLDFKIFVHLPPGGVLVARGGLGGALLDTKLSFISDVGLEFYFFPAERVYLGFGYKKYFFPTNTVYYNGNTAESEGFVFFQIGYFWPELRMGARGLLD
ncbi:MAG: hypothetical protein ACHQYQ_07370 [Bacteriovoracales bacterium]